MIDKFICWIFRHRHNSVGSLLDTSYSAPTGEMVVDGGALKRVDS